MQDQLITWALVAASIATALIAGVFLTFSDFIMRSLGSAQAEAGVEAMQQINRKVYRSIFMLLLIGMVPVSAAAVAYAGWLAPDEVAAWLAAGGLLYVGGVFAVTAIFNVPMNKRLDAMDPAGAEAAQYWPAYTGAWTGWNHVRSAASLAAAACYLVAAMQQAGAA